MAKKCILITGAAGSFGFHLCDRFIKEDYHVIGMDNLVVGLLILFFCAFFMYFTILV